MSKVSIYHDLVIRRFPYLRNIHSPKDFSDMISYEEAKFYNKGFFKTLNALDVLSCQNGRITVLNRGVPLATQRVEAGEYRIEKDFCGEALTSVTIALGSKELPPLLAGEAVNNPYSGWSEWAVVEDKEKRFRIMGDDLQKELQMFSGRFKLFIHQKDNMSVDGIVATTVTV